MIDLQGKITLVSNVTELTNQINTSLKNVKGKINLITPTSIKYLQATIGALKLINKELKQVIPNARAMAHAFDQVGNSFQNMKGNITSVGKGFKTVTQEATKTKEAVHESMTVLQQFGHQAAIAARRYTAFSLAVGIGFGTLRAMKLAITESIKFQDKLVKLSQVSGKTLADLKPLSNEITRLSTEFGVSSDKLADVSLTLLQAGMTSRETKKALEALAKVELAPSFGDMTNATESAIAILHQFYTEANMASKGVDNLEAHLGSINAVSAKFAVEAEDIVLAVQRAGAAYGALTKDLDNPKQALNEFVALFTSVRQTTRESAETIATGMRTIFTRLQRNSTATFFHDMNIELRDSQKQFIGLFPAIERISEAIADIPQTDPRMAAITEELGGFRQINKTIPLLTQLAVAKEALAVAQAGENSLNESAVTGMQSMSRQLDILTEKFLALFRTLQDTGTFKAMFTTFTNLANITISFANAIKELLPLLTAFAAIKIARGGLEFAGAFKDTIMNRVPHKASGGYVGGHGIGDTVPAMLSPKEFVIKASAAKRIGSKGLHTLNNADKFAGGGGPDYPVGSSGILASLGFQSSQTRSNVPATMAKAKDAFAKTLDMLTGKLKTVVSTFTLINNDLANKRGGALLDAGYKSIMFGSKGTMGQVAEEIAHAIEVALSGTPKKEGLSSHTSGTVANKIAQEFAPIRLAELKKSGAKSSDIKYHMQSHELFAQAVSRMTPEQQSSVFSMMSSSMTPPQMPIEDGTEAIRNSRRLRHGDPTKLGYKLNPQWTHGEGMASPVSGMNGMTSQGQISNAGLSYMYNSGRQGQSIFGKMRGGIAARNRNIGSFFAAANKNSTVQRLGSSNAHFGAAIGAVALSGMLGSASTNSREERTKGMYGDTASGAFAGFGTGGMVGAAVGGPLGGAIGAVVGGLTGLVTSLETARDTIKRLDFSDAIEDVNKYKGTKGSLEHSALVNSIGSKIDTMLKPEESWLPDMGAAFETLKSEFTGGNTTYAGLMDKKNAGQRSEFYKAHGEELGKILEPEMRSGAKKFGNYNDYIQSKEGIAAFQKYAKYTGLTGRDAQLGHMKAAGFIESGDKVNHIKDTISDNISKFKDLAHALESAIVASNGFSQNMEMVSSFLKGGAHSAFMTDKSALIRNPNNATFGATAGALDSLLGANSGGAKFASFVGANLDTLAGNVQSAGTVEGSADALSQGFAKLKSNFVKKHGGGADVDQMSRTIFGAMETNLSHEKLQDKSKEEIKSILGNAYGALPDALADIAKQVTTNGNDFISAMNQVQDGMTQLSTNAYENNSSRIGIHNQASKFAGFTTGSRTTQGAFQAMQGELAARTGINGNDNEALGAALMGVHAQQRALNGGGTIKEIVALNNQERALQAALNANTDAVKNNSSIEERLAEVQAEKGERAGLAQRILTGDPAERNKALRSMALTNALNMGSIGDLKKLTPEDNQLLMQGVKDMAHILPNIEHLYQGKLEQTFPNLFPKEMLNEEQGLKNQILGNMGLAVGAKEQLNNAAGAGIGAFGENAVKLWEESTGKVLGDFNAKFGEHVNNLVGRLEAIPKDIQLGGRVELNIQINGAETFAKMEPQLKEMMEARINKAVADLTSKLRAKAPNGPGLQNV